LAEITEYKKLISDICIKEITHLFYTTDEYYVLPLTKNYKDDESESTGVKGSLFILIKLKQRDNLSNTTVILTIYSVSQKYPPLWFSDTFSQMVGNF